MLDILLYLRDGVGDQDIANLKQKEMHGVLNALNTQAPNAHFACVLVQKRVPTMLFGLNGTNVPPGSVVRGAITRDPNAFYTSTQDVFLQSTAPNTGAMKLMRPTHYDLLYSTIPGVKLDDVQKLMFQLSCCYYNFPGTIKVRIARDWL